MKLGGRVSPRQARYFSLLRQRNVPKRKATPLSVSLRVAAGNLRCSRAGCGRRTHFAPKALRSDNCGQSEHDAWASFGAQADPTRCASRHGQRGRSMRAIASLGLGRFGAALETFTTFRLILSKPDTALRQAQREQRGVGARASASAYRSGWLHHIQAERSDGPCRSPRPSVCAWVGVLAGWRLHRRMQPLRDLAGRSCLNGAA